ncbi:Uncharacterised protein [Listeria innocua]|nr:Uncharacterised protein [Listeria innocua]
MKLGTQNQAFFPENIEEKFAYVKEMGFEGFEIDGKLLVENLDEVKSAIKKRGYLLVLHVAVMTVGLVTSLKSAD